MLNMKAIPYIKADMAIHQVTSPYRKCSWSRQGKLGRSSAGRSRPNYGNPRVCQLGKDTCYQNTNTGMGVPCDLTTEIINKQA